MRKKVGLYLGITAFLVAGLYVLFCVSYKAKVYGTFLKKAECFEEQKQSGYPEYKDFTASVWVTDSWFGTRGNISLTQTRYLAEDVEGNDYVVNNTIDIIAFPKVFGGYKIRVLVSPGNGEKGVGFYIDEGLQLLEDDPDIGKIYEKHFDEIQKRVDLLIEVFGL